MKLITGILGLLWKLYIAVIFAVTALLLYPIITLQLTTTKSKKRAFKFFVFWSWLFRVLCLYGVRRVRNEKLPEGQYLIVANHSSYLDIFLMYSLLPKQPFLFLGKSELLSYPLIKTYFKKMNIPVFRENQRKAAMSLIQAAKATKEGWSIMIFPEGGIPDDNLPEMVPFKSGAFKLAKNVKLPIVPITFENNYKLFSDPSHWLGPASPGISKVHIHSYISSEQVQEMTEQELADHCFKIVNGPIRERLDM